MPLVAGRGSPECRPSGPATSEGQFLSELNDVQFVSSKRGWVVGTGRILATVDGGLTWRVQYRGKADLISVDFVNSRSGFAVGTDQLLATDDGGRRWSEREEPCLVIRALDFTSTSFGYAIAGGEPFLTHDPFQGGELLVTLDGGHHWYKDTTAPTGIQSLSFVTQQNGWIGTPGRVWHTSDGGLHWSVSFTEPGRDPKSSYEGDVPLVQHGGLHGAWVLFLGSGAAMSHSPYVAFATRNGQHWHSVMEETYTEQGAMPEVHAPDGPGTYPGPFSAVTADAAVFVGFGPSAPVAPMDIATDNGRKLSSPRSVTGIYEPTGAFFLSSDSGWVIGLASWNDLACAIETTSNGGHTWTLQWSSTSPRTKK
jgi:photosystem II stability/assembly factor-like uncharacterized protein